MSVETVDPTRGHADDWRPLLQQVGELIARGQSRTDARFDRLEADLSGMKADVSGMKADVSGMKADVSGMKADVSGMKTDVSGMKTDIARLDTGLTEVREQLRSLELASEARGNRVDAQFERLFALIQRDETKRS